MPRRILCTLPCAVALLLAVASLGAETALAAAEVTPEEYAVYAAFLESGGVVEKGEPPPYLGDAAKARALRVLTAPGIALTSKVLDWFAASCGGLDPSLAQDYEAQREQQAEFGAGLPLPGVALRGPEQDRRPTGPATMERMSRPGGWQKLFGEAISLSRVGFSQDRGAALFFVESLEMNPGTTYLVLMHKRQGRWVLSCALLDKIWIY